MLAAIMGLIAVIMGLWGVISWWPDFMTVVRGAMPFMFIVGGAIAIVAGITSIVELAELRNERSNEESKEAENLK